MLQYSLDLPSYSFINKYRYVIPNSGWKKGYINLMLLIDC